MKKSVLLLSAVFIITSSMAGYADSKSKAVNLINSGVNYIQKKGKNRAFKEFSKKNGKFTRGEFYIFVVDFEGLTLAHGGNAALVGKSMFNLKDTDGVYFIRKMIDTAKDKGTGWVNYKWSNPKTKKIADKTTYVKRMPGTNYFLGCGFYLK